MKSLAKFLQQKQKILGGNAEIQIIERLDEEEEDKNIVTTIK